MMPAKVDFTERGVGDFCQLDFGNAVSPGMNTESRRFAK